MNVQHIDARFKIQEEMRYSPCAFPSLAPRRRSFGDTSASRRSRFRFAWGKFKAHFPFFELSKGVEETIGFGGDESRERSVFWSRFT
jgi:hypothetical protein